MAWGAGGGWGVPPPRVGVDDFVLSVLPERRLLRDGSPSLSWKPQNERGLNGPRAREVRMLRLRRVLMMPSAAQEVIGMEHWVEHEGVRIYIWEKYDRSPSGKPVVVLAHGSAPAGQASV